MMITFQLKALNLDLLSLISILGTEYLFKTENFNQKFFLEEDVLIFPKMSNYMDGENIWDISSWTGDIHWKDAHLHRHFDALQFSDAIKDVVDLAETYFQSVYDRYSEDEHSSEFTFPYLDILVLITEEYLCGQFFHSVTPLQELQLLELLCRYFQDNKLDPVRYFVFDCLFGLPSENLDLQRSLIDHKLSIICKLASIAISAACGNVLNCIAVWMHTYGSQHHRASKIASTVVNDYFYICPKAIHAVKDLINVSPVFAYQFIIALSDYYKEKSSEKDSSNSLPPGMFVNVVSDWIIEKANFCLLNIPRVFLELPSVHKFNSNSRVSLFRSCPLFSFMEWTLIHPLVKDKSDTHKEDTIAYSKLHYGFLTYISSQKKGDLNPSDDSDDLEPGELLEEEVNIELLNKADVFYLINCAVKNIDTYADSNLDNKEECINRLIQVLQVSKWSGCMAVQLKQLKPLLTNLPQTKLVDDFLTANR